MKKCKIIQLTGLAIMSVLVISACGKSVKTMSTISISRYETSPQEETETTDINESVTDTHNTETPGVNETNTINEATAPPKIAGLETEEEEIYDFDYTLPNTFEQPTAKEKPDEVSYIKGMFHFHRVISGTVYLTASDNPFSFASRSAFSRSYLRRI